MEYQYLAQMNGLVQSETSFVSDRSLYITDVYSTTACFVEVSTDSTGVGPSRVNPHQKIKGYDHDYKGLRVDVGRTVVIKWTKASGVRMDDVIILACVYA